MAFSTVTGSNGVTSLVGTTGIDTATIVSLDSNVFVGANTGDDIVSTDLLTGGLVASDFNVRLGGGDDTFTTTGGDTIVSSFISGDGLTLANDGNDTITLGDVFNSEIVGRGGADDIVVGRLFSSTINGNTGIDFIDVLGNSADSFVYGGQGNDEITSDGDQRAMLYNGNRGADSIILGNDEFVAGSVYGGQGTDFINADAVDVATDEAGVFLSGDLGDDRIIGSDGEDTVNGGEGTDELTGGLGADTITTGAGNDEVILALADSLLSAADSSTGFDTITDFSANTAAAAADKNGDTINAGDLTFIGFATDGGTSATTVALDSLGDSLAEDLTAFIDGGDLTAGEAIAITIRGSAWAGSYVVLGGGTANYQFGEDAVIKLDTSVANLTSEAFEAF